MTEFRRTGPGSPTARVSGWSADHPWRALTAWLLFVALCLGTGLAVGGNQAGAADYRVGEAGRADAMAEQGGVGRAPVEDVLIGVRSGSDAGPDRTGQAAADTARRMRALPEVSAVAEPVRSADGATVRVEVRMHGEVLQAKRHVDPLSAQTAGVAEAFPELDVAQVGDGTISKGLDGQRSDDLARTEMISLPVTLVVLALVFGSVMMVGVPIALAATSIMAAIGLAMLASHTFPDAGVGTNMILLIGLAVGVDYSLFVAKRERDERGCGQIDAAARVRIASATAGRTVVDSGIAVVACAATLLVTGDVIFSSLAVGTIVVTAVAVLSSVTALPALLMLLGRRADRRPLRRTSDPARPGAVWTAVERVTDRRPTATLMVAVLGMAVLALPVLGMQLRELNRDTHSREIGVMQTYDRLTAAFPDRRPHLVVVQTPTPQQPAVTDALRDLAQRYGPAAAGTEIRWSGDGRTAALALPMPYRLVSPEAAESMQTLRGELLPATVGQLPEATYAVDGLVARGVDEVAHQDEILPRVLGLLALTTVLVTAVTFRSVLLGVLGALLSALSALSAFGVLVVFFQWGLASTVLGADPASAAAIGSRVPLFGVVILTALAIDYQFFVLGRVREAARAGASAADAVREGLRGSARTVTSAAVVMATVFASFVPLHLAEMKQIGFVLAVGVLLDAFVVRILILPGLLSALGDRIRWPPAEERLVR